MYRPRLKRGNLKSIGLGGGIEAWIQMRITDPSLVQSSAKREARREKCIVLMSFRRRCWWDFPHLWKGLRRLAWLHAKMITNGHLSKDTERFPKQMIMISGCSRRHSNTRSFVTMWVGNAQETCANSVLESVKDFVQTKV